MTAKPPSAAVALVPETTSYGLVTQDTLTSMLSQAQLFFKSGVCPPHITNPEALVVTALYGRELRMSFSQAMSGIFVINGVPGLQAKDQLAIIRRDMPEAEIVFLEQSNEACRIKARRTKADEFQEFGFTWQDAVHAQLNTKDTYMKHPADMLTARAIGRMTKALFSDTLRGFCYTPEEVRDIAKAQAERVAPVQARGTATASPGARVAVKGAPMAPPVIDARFETVPEIHQHDSRDALGEDVQYQGDEARCPFCHPDLAEPEILDLGETPPPPPGTRQNTMVTPEEMPAPPAAPAPAPLPPAFPEEEPIRRPALIRLINDLNSCNFNVNLLDLVYGKFLEANSDHPPTLVEGYGLHAMSVENAKGTNKRLLPVPQAAPAQGQLLP